MPELKPDSKPSQKAGKSRKKEGASFHRKKGGFRLFGLNKQDYIRYFFGGNASAAILILALICVFLFLQGKNFLPEYHQSLQIARGSGIDLHDHIDKQYQLIKQYNGGFNRAYTTEYYHPGLHYNNLAESHAAIRRFTANRNRRDMAILRDLEKRIKEREEAEEFSTPPGNTAPVAEEKEFTISSEDIEAFETGLTEFGEQLASLPAKDASPDEIKEKRMALLRTMFAAKKPTSAFNPPKKSEATEEPVNLIPLEKLQTIHKNLIKKIAANTRQVLEELDRNEILEAREISDEEFQKIKDEIASLADNPTARDREFPLYQEFSNERDRLNGERADFAKQLNDLFRSLGSSADLNLDDDPETKQPGAAKPLDDLWSMVSKRAVSTKDRANSASTVVNRLKGPLGIYRVAKESQAKVSKLTMMLKECATAEFFHPGARLYYIAALDSIMREELAAYAGELAKDAISKAKIVQSQAAILRVAVDSPSEKLALAEAYGGFDKAFTNAQQALMKMKAPTNLYSDMFVGDEGKAALSKLEGYLETISTALPDYKEKITSGSFSEADLAALEAAAGDGGTVDKGLATTLIEAGNNLPDGTLEFVEKIVAMAPEAQLPFPFADLAEPLYEAAKAHGPILEQLKKDIKAALDAVPEGLESPYAIAEIEVMRLAYDEFIDSLDHYSAKIADWHHDEEQSFFDTTSEFLFGTKWTNNSAIQDRYGLLPLLTGSFIISIIAITIAVPIGISAAIYVNQIAGPKQQKFLKPVVEFIGIIPSIVLGFLGIAILGDTLKEISNSPLLDWMPGLPIVSRLNMLTAATLLAFMAIPTIFSLTEDALNNVPTHLRQASLALGATNLQTAFRVVVPAAMSGIIAAVLLGFGRVIGETMVVLLVAGNRISMPDVKPALEWIGIHPAATLALIVGSLAAIVLGIIVRVKKGLNGGPVGFLAGLALFPLFITVAFVLLSFATQPSHTMTGIIAQGLGEASVGSTGWQALFMVGLVLFTISLIINYIAQKIVTSLSIENQMRKKQKPRSVSTNVKEAPSGA